MDWLEDFLPIGICVIVPIVIVWLNLRASNNKVNKTSEIIMKALDNSATLESVNVDKLVEALRSSKKSARETLNKRLLNGCLFSFIGIAAGLLAAWNYFKSPIDTEIGRYTITFFIAVIAGLSLSIGLAHLLVYFITRKSVNQDNKD